MNSLRTIKKSLFLDKEAMAQFSQSEKMGKWSTLLIGLLGAIYGGLSIYQNLETVQALESPLLRTVLMPLLLVGVGVITVWLTVFVFSLLLWAAARGFGGAGILRIIRRVTSIALLPAAFAMPAFITFTSGGTLTMLHIGLALVALIWIYLLCVKALEATQQFETKKAYIAVLIMFVFFTSIYYIILPPVA